MKEKIRQFFKTLWEWIKLLTNPRFFLCFGIAWIICHGWSLIFILLGHIFKISWMLSAGIFWISILLMPNGVGILTAMPIAIFLQRKLFPNDHKLKDKLLELLQKVKNKNKGDK